jgi:hypothetical protein
MLGIRPSMVRVCAGSLLLSGAFVGVFGAAGVPDAFAAGQCGANGTYSTTGGTSSCSYTGTGADTFTVPAGVTNVEAVADGGAGAANGGRGAQVTAYLTVTPGTTENVEVGVGGGSNGFYGGGPGGGLSGIYTCADVTDVTCAVLVAGGGGGRTVVNVSAGGGDAGMGTGSCNAGQAGESNPSGTAGTGGTCSAGGTGNGGGGDGGPGSGGNGCCYYEGGGGAGYYGGGSGSGYNGGGAGGGSSFVEAGASNVSMVANRSGTPSMTIWWGAGPPSATISSPGGGSTYTPGQSVATSFACSQATGGSPVASCTDSNGSASATGTLDTSTVGTFTYMVTAVSADGEIGTSSISYSVAWPPGSPCGTRGTPVSANECSYTTVGEDTFTVPPGVTTVKVVADGGAGAANGGHGAEVTAYLAVTLGTAESVAVGMGGGQHGFYGGGDGGGLSGIYTCADVTDVACAVLVAGGGGGRTEAGGGDGGDAGIGSASCNPGADGQSTAGNSDGGGGGTCTGGGTGTNGNGAGGPGAGGTEGIYYDGGGGAGYYGGASGSGYAGGGGGGGSSFVDASASNVSMVTNTAGSPSLTITWDTPGTALAIGAPPANITVAASGPDGAAVNYTPPTATDESGEVPPVSCDHPSGSTFPLGTTAVTCTVTDADDIPSSVSNSFTVTVYDTDLAISTPANIVAVATSPSGAAVSFTPPTATDEDGTTVSVSCAPLSGSVFPIGTTTVTCSASDSDDANSPVSTSFTVKVGGASALLANLAISVQGVGPGNSLPAKVAAAESYLAAGDLTDTCLTLTALVNEVNAQTNKSITAGVASKLIAATQLIRAVLHC